MANESRSRDRRPDPRASAETRRASPLVFKHDADLPIAARREEISEALNRHQVLIVAGDTGSGKSTQLPQYCLELGRGIEGLIAHTQPRRLAARALAARIAEELTQPVGAAVGYRVRFADQVSPATRLVLMTDGLLLAELTSDPLLRRYDTIIVDEAHERTLNIDLLLGVLKRLLPKRPDLKLIVTSATLDVERVALFFGDAPILSVSGRMHPIEVRYTDNVEEDPDLPLAILTAFRDIAATPGAVGRGDALVFLPGEREIHDVGDFLERELGANVDILSLYSRLSWEQQSKIFQRGARQRIVLATNVAETSITVPGIRSVIDSGLARVSRYSPRNRLQRLPIEPVSRASAEQRKGRCGRLGPGLCVRLYSEADYDDRPAFTEPEVLRTNLAALLLRLAADGLGEAENFPFIDAPDSRSLGDGYRLLQELEALDDNRRITRLGRAMARLPLDPRLARALLESKRFHAESEVLAIVAGLSVPDARITAPGGAPNAAGGSGSGSGGGGGGGGGGGRSDEDSGGPAAFEDSKSEFTALVKLWRAYKKVREGPRREVRRWCKERSLSVLRLSEWEDVYSQVVDRAKELGITAQPKPASYTGVHRSLLAGFCTMVGTRDEEGAYVGTRGVRFHIFPGSPLRRRRPRWVMAANIVETSRVFARRVAEIEPTWIESAAHHLLKREFLEPDWDEAREEVVARERVSLLGLILSANRVVNYGRIAPEESRLIFAREALVYRRLHRRPDWLRANDAAIEAAQRMEERLRTRDLLQPPERFVEFYNGVLPRQVSSGAGLEYFTRNLAQPQRAALTLKPDDIFARSPDPQRLERFPEQVTLGEQFGEVLGEAGAADGTAAKDATGAGGATQSAQDGMGGSRLWVPVDYRFAPGEAGDGATLRVPLLAVPILTRAMVDAAVPGLAEPRVEALLRSLPKEARRNLIPMGATVTAFMEFMGAPSTNMQRLAAWLKEHRGIPEPLVRFDVTAIPAHLTAQLAVIAGGKELAQGSDLGLLRRRFAASARAELERLARTTYPAPWRRFEADALPDSVEVSLDQSALSQDVRRQSALREDALRQGTLREGTLREGTLRLHPTLVRGAHAVEVRYEWTPEEAGREFRQGSEFLARLMLDRQARDMTKKIGADTQFMLAASPYLHGEELVDILLQLTFRRACFEDTEAPRTRAAFEATVDRGRERLYPMLDEVMEVARNWFAEARSVRRLLEDMRARQHAELVEEAQGHLRHLLSAAGILGLSGDWLRQLPRYIKAEERRWQRLFARGSEPPQVLRELKEWSARAQSLENRVSAEARWLPQLGEFRAWMEEYRVSLYAQELRTLGPVSAARLGARVAEIEAWLTR